MEPFYESYFKNLNHVKKFYTIKNKNTVLTLKVQFF